MSTIVSSNIISIGKPGTKGSKKLTVGSVEHSNVHFSTLKLGGMKKFMFVGDFYASLPKSEARKVRKALRANGKSGLAGARRAA